MKRRLFSPGRSRECSSAVISSQSCLRCSPVICFCSFVHLAVLLTQTDLYCGRGRGQRTSPRTLLPSQKFLPSLRRRRRALLPTSVLLRPPRRPFVRPAAFFAVINNRRLLERARARTLLFSIFLLRSPQSSLSLSLSLSLSSTVVTRYALSQLSQPAAG